MKHMMDNDRHTWWRPGRLWLPASTFDLIPGIRGTGGAVTADVQFNATGGPGPDATELVSADAAAIYRLPLYSAGVGNPEFLRIGIANGPHGCLMTAAGDDVRQWVRIPGDLDPQYNVYARVHWTSAAAAVGARDITWKVMYHALLVNSTVAAPSTVLNKVIPVDTPTGTAHQWQMTDEGVINGGVLSERTEMLGLIVEMDAFNAALSESKYFMGLELRYTPRRFYYGDGMYHEAKAPVSTISRHYA